MKTQLLLPLAAFGAILAPTASHAAVIVGWAAFADDAGTVFDADVLQTGFSGDISYSGGSGQVNGIFSSNDTTYGSLAGATDAGTSALLVRSASGDTFTLNFTNNSGSSWNIETLRFDFAARQESGGSPSQGYNSFTATYTSGGLGPASTQVASASGLAYVISGTTGRVSDYPDFDYTLSDNLTDLVLADGESALFTFQFSGGSGSNSQNVSSIIDNIAITGTAVPEPSSALLGAFGTLLLLRRKR